MPPASLHEPFHTLREAFVMCHRVLKVNTLTGAAATQVGSAAGGRRLYHNWLLFGFQKVFERLYKVL